MVFKVSKRLQQELMSLMLSGDKGISAFPEGDKLLTWVATVTGPDDSVYEGKDERYKIHGNNLLDAFNIVLPCLLRTAA